VRVAGITAGGALLMLGLSFAAVPLYDLFCRATGYDGTPRIVTSAPANTGDRIVTVRFDANVANGLMWRFEPEVGSIALRTGEVATVSYKITNNGPTASTAIASYNVTPELAGSYFSKIACFCFTEQTLQPGETREEQVVFFVDPDIARDAQAESLHTITLSYTFFPSKTTPQPVAAVAETMSTRNR